MQLRDEKQNVAWFDFRRFGKWLRPDPAELQPDEWQRPPPVRESNVLDLREAPPKVKWTKDWPAVPGVYAIRAPGGPRRFVEVEADKRGRLMASWTDIDPFPVVRCGMEFSQAPYMEPE